MSPTTLPTVRRQQGLHGRHVLGMFLAFFGAVFAVNGAMIYSAVSTHTGLVAIEPYRKGLHYNDRIAADARQARLGWSDTVELGRDGSVRLTLVEADGRPVRGMAVDGVLGRPATNRQDVTLALSETAPGRYEAAAGALAAGSWLISLEARAPAGGESIYRLRRRVWLAR